MKKIAFLLTGLFMAGTMFFAACSTDSTTPGDPNPAMNFVGGVGYISADATVSAGSIFKVGINAFSSTETNAKLANFKVTRIFQNKPTVVLDSTINIAQFSIDLNIGSNPAAGVENFVFRITDKDGMYKELSFNITTEMGAGAINTFSMKILGAQGSATGSSFASIDGSVYGQADAKTNAAKVDWLYYYGNTTDFATIAAPDDDHAALIFTNATYGLQTWSVLNSTKFKRVTDAITWDAITDDAVIVAQTASGVDQSRIVNLDVTDILAFTTVGGKKGLIRVENIAGTQDGEITISVKVQQ